MDSYSPPTVTIPFSGRFPGATQALQELAAKRRGPGMEEPLTSRSELMMILAIAAAMIGVTVFIFAGGRSNYAFGGLLAVISIVAIAALFRAHATGGIDAAGRIAPADTPDTATAGAQVNDVQAHGAQDQSIRRIQHRIAPRRTRLFAELFDWAVTLAPFAALFLRLGSEDGRMRGGSWWLGLVFLFYFVMMAPLFLWLTNGRTPGKLLFNTRVVRADGHRIGLIGAIKRETIFKWWHSHFFWLTDISSLYADPLHRSQHDISAKTFVVIDRPARADH